MSRIEKRLWMLIIAAISGFGSWKIWPIIISDGNAFGDDPLAIVYLPFFALYLFVAGGCSVLFVASIAGFLFPDKVLKDPRPPKE